jgi:hypothetical protein
MNCANEMALAQSAYLSGDFAEARLHFTLAHGTCHEDKKLHLGAHWGLCRVALRHGNIVESLKQTALLLFAALFD